MSQDISFKLGSQLSPERKKKTMLLLDIADCFALLVDPQGIR
jgi:hypothetical protein